MSQFKPGDSALIIGYTTTPVNVGKSCELVAFLQPGERVDFSTAGVGGTRNIGDRAAWLVAGDALVATSGTTGCTLVLEKNLMPLRGNFAPEQQKSREVVL